MAGEQVIAADPTTARMHQLGGARSGHIFRRATVGGAGGIFNTAAAGGNASLMMIG